MEKNKTPFALLINDIHVDRDRIPEFIANWDEALQVCEEHNIRRIIIGGDLWLSRSTQTLSTLLAVKSALQKARSKFINVTIAEGNHDKVDQNAVDGYSHLFSEYSGVEVIDDYAVCEMKDGDVFTDLFVMSYFPENGSFMEHYNEMVAGIDPDRKAILYCHQGIRGGLATPSDDELPANIFDKFDKVLVGHYHNRKKIPGTNIEYIGASRQHNFGEDEDKGYTILYTDGSYEFVKNEVNVRYKVVDVCFDDATSDDFLQELKEINDEGRYRIKVRVICSSSQAQGWYGKGGLDAYGAYKVELVIKQATTSVIEEQELSKKYDKDSIKQEYVDFCSNKAINNIKMGLAYLEKYTDK